MELSPSSKPLAASTAHFHTTRSFRRWSGFIAGLSLLLALATQALAQSSPQVTGTYRMCEYFQTNYYIGGRSQIYEGTTTNPAVDVSQSGDTFVFWPGDAARSWTGTLAGNNVTSITGELLRGASLNNFAVETNAVLQSWGSVTSTQMVMYIRARFSGTNDAIYYRFDVQKYIYLYGDFNPLQPPRILTQPLSLTNVAGTAAAFSVQVTGATNFTYQWRKNGFLIVNATDSSYRIEQTRAADVGTYTVQIANPAGSTNSLGARLVLNYPPTITAQPAGLKRVLGTKGTLSVRAAGTGRLGYQWRLFDNAIDGATNSTYTFTALPANSGTNLTFSVAVSNLYGAVISSNATVTILPDTTLPTVTITTPLLNGRVSAGLFAGTATDNGRITNVIYWVTNLTDGSISARLTATLIGTNPANLTWRATNQCRPGSNVLAVCGQDLQGNNSRVVSRRFFYKVAAPFALTASGTGTGTVKGRTGIPAPGEPLPILGTTNLYIGQAYSVQALPNAANSFFTNWSATEGLVTNATYSFIMRPNLVLQANFVTNLFLGMTGAYNGLFAATNAAGLESMGALRNLVLNRTGFYSGQLLLKGTVYPLSGNFDPSGHARKTIVRPALSGGPLRLEMNLDWNNTPRHLFGTLAPASNAPAWSAELLADLAFNPIGSGQYTAILPLATNAPADGPGGWGFLTMTNKNGNVSLSGVLGDGTPVAWSVPISKEARIPVYTSLFANSGLLWGWLDLSSGAPVGELIWMKKTAASGLYPHGFTNHLPVLGSPWSRPSVLPFNTNHPGSLFLSGGGLANPLQLQAGLLSNNTLVEITSPPSKGLSGKVDPKTGVMTLSFVRGTTNVAGSAAILQNQTNAFGVFRGRTNSGSIQLW